MKLWGKVGSGFKSNILILITVALWHKVTQSADALAHLISFMSWRIWISQDTRAKQKVISASFAYLNLVESKLNCQNRDYLPLRILLRVLMTIFWYHGEFTDRIFYWSPAWTKTTEFEQSVEVRTDATLNLALSKVSLAWTFLPVEIPTLLGVVNGSLKSFTARKIVPLLDLLAKFKRVLACSCSQNVCSYICLL